MTDRLALPRRYRDQLEALLRQHVPGIEVWAYGSRVNGESHEGSDLDLVLRGPSQEPLDGGFYDLLEAIEKSNIPILIQANDWAMLPESFHREIERDYIVVQQGAKQATGGWQEASLGEVIELKRGYDLPQRKRIPGSVPLVSSSGVTYYHTEAKVRGPGVVTGRYGTLGEVFFVPSDFWPLNTTLYVRDFKGNDPRFISYFLRGLDFSAYSDKAAVAGLNRNHLHQAAVRYPADITEQRAISHVLGTLDDKIELNRRMNETLEEMARALFKSWFVDFDPVRAKMEGRWHRGESLPGLPAEHYDLFSDRLVYSELGPIPEGWEVTALGEMVELNPPEPMKRGILAPYLDMAALPTSGSGPEKAVLRGFKSGTRFRNGDTLLARITPCLENGKTAYVQSLPEGIVGWGSTEFIVLRAVPPVPPEYTYLLARDAGFREHAIQSMTGTSGRQRVQVDAIAPYPLPSPTTETWNGFSALVSPLFAQVESSSTAKNHSPSLRNGIRCYRGWCRGMSE